MSLWRCGIISASHARALGSTLTFCKNFINEFTEFCESSLGKTPLKYLQWPYYGMEFVLRSQTSPILWSIWKNKNNKINIWYATYIRLLKILLDFKVKYGAYFTQLKSSLCDIKSVLPKRRSSEHIGRLIRAKCYDFWIVELFNVWPHV